MTTKRPKPPWVEPGLGVDAAGDPVVDPTANVLDLVSAAVARLNDLRAAEIRRVDDLREMETRHNREMQTMLLDFQDKLREAESKRIDAIRSVDVNAVAVASGRATDQAAVLATQVQVSAETLRTLVANTAASMAAAANAASVEFTKRLTELEKSKSEIVGKSAATDPQMAQLLAAVEGLRGHRAASEGRSAGANWLWGLIVGGIGLLATLLVILDRLRP